MGNANLGNKSNKKPQEKRTRVLGGNDERNTKKTVKTTPKTKTTTGTAPKQPAQGFKVGRGNVGHIKTVAVKNAVDSFMRRYGVSGIEAREMVRGMLGPDFRSLSASQQRDWPDVVLPREPEPYGGGYYDDGGGGGGGGGGYTPPTPPIPEMKIRTTAGQRHDQYWESMPPYNRGFEPRFVILGSNQDW